MENRVNYTLVGLFVLILTAVIIFIGVWLSSSHHGKDYKTYAIVMRESVYGLSEQAPVKFNGVSVGYIDDVRLNPKNLQEVILIAKIGKHVPITISTVASLKTQGITGITFVGLEARSPTAPKLKRHKGEAYPIIPSEPSTLLQLSDSIRDATNNLNKVTQRVQQIFNDENMVALQHMIKNLEQFSETLAHNSPQLIDNMQSTFAVMTSVGSSIDQTWPGVARLVQRLETISANLEFITGDLQQNPSVLIRGKTPLKKGPGE